MAPYVVAIEAKTYVSKPEMEYNNTPEKHKALARTKADQLYLALLEKMEAYENDA